MKRILEDTCQLTTRSFVRAMHSVTRLTCRSNSFVDVLPIEANFVIIKVGRIGSTAQKAIRFWT